MRKDLHALLPLIVKCNKTKQKIILYNLCCCCNFSLAFHAWSWLIPPPPTFVLPKNSETSRTMNGLSHKHLAALKGSFWGQRLPVKAKLTWSFMHHLLSSPWLPIWVSNLGCARNLCCKSWVLEVWVFLVIPKERGFSSSSILEVWVFESFHHWGGVGYFSYFMIDWSFLSNVYFVLLLEGLVQGFVCLLIYFKIFFSVLWCIHKRI
jgi:hypothetical protein